MNVSTDGLSPKAVAAAVAALIVPFLAKTLGLDEAALLALVTAVVTAAVTWAAPPGKVSVSTTDDSDHGIDEALQDAATTPTIQHISTPDEDSQGELS